MINEHETRLLKAIASNLLEPLWHEEFFAEAENYILYNDPKTKKSPRNENEIKKIKSELDRLRNDVLDEIVEDLFERGFTSIDKISNNFSLVREIIHKRFGVNRRSLWDVIESLFSTN